MAEHDLVVGTAGHIDHGKTALVRALTGVDTDRLPAERQRGITIDLGFAPLELGASRLALVDVPGHERFVRNMLAGATGLDLALLVVAADDSVMPQSREHLEILRLLGIPAGLVALTKCDLADPAWLALVEDDVRALVAGTFLEGSPVVRTSSATGQGLDDLRAALAAVCRAVPPRDDPGHFRMGVDRSFTVPGHGTVVTGTVASGSVALGDDLTLWPEGRPVRVRGLHRHDRPVESVGRGARAAVNLAGVHHAEVRRGHELAAPGYLVPTRVLSVTARASDDAPRPLRHRARYRLHLGTAEVAATLSLLGANELLPGESSPAQLLVGESVVAVSGQPFVLREESPPATLGGGRVLQPTARRLRRRDRDAVALLDPLGSPDPNARASAAVCGFGVRTWSDLDLCREAGIPAAGVSRVIAALTESGTLVPLSAGPRRAVRVHAGVAAALEDRALRALRRLHEEFPRQSSIPRSRLAAALPDLDRDGLVPGVLDRLAARGLVVASARAVALKGFEPRLSQSERRLKAELASALHDGGFTPPDVPALSASAGPRAAVVPELLQLLGDEERAVRVGPHLYLDFDAATELHRRVLARFSTSPTLTVADLRDLLGTTRKYAVPLSEYLDRVGLTVRDGDFRRPGPADPDAGAGSPERHPRPPEGDDPP